MNYFAHARVAAARDAATAADPAFVLGAMLPDFAHMIGARVASLAHPALRSGAHHHQRADAAFHRVPAFLALVRDATRALAQTGLARGPARGAAHVGIELLFDGALVGDPAGDAAYVSALDAAPGLDVAIRWSRGDGALRFERLRARLAEAGPPFALREPMRVAERVERALAPRPLLALAPHEVPRLERWLADARPAVVEAAPRLLAETLARIAAEQA